MFKLGLEHRLLEAERDLANVPPARVWTTRAIGRTWIAFPRPAWIRLSAHPLTICVLFAFRQWPWSIASRAEEMPRERHPASRSHVLAHLGLVAGMVAARGLGASMDRA